jgi:hypothetical protein
MKGLSVFIVVAAWITVCGWTVEKIGNLIPDRSMRLLTKFLLFAIIATMPLLNVMAKAAELCASAKWGEQKAQWCAIAMSAYAAPRKGSQ